MSDIIRVGYISNVNYAEGTAQVVYKDRDNAVSPYLPFASTHRSYSGGFGRIFFLLACFSLFANEDWWLSRKNPAWLSASIS